MKHTDSKLDTVSIFGVLLILMLAFSSVVLVLEALGLWMPSQDAKIKGRVVTVELSKGSALNKYKEMRTVVIDSEHQSRRVLCVMSDSDFAILINANKHEENVDIIYHRPAWLAPWECKGGDGLIKKVEAVTASTEAN